MRRHAHNSHIDASYHVLLCLCFCGRVRLGLDQTTTLDAMKPFAQVTYTGGHMECIGRKLFSLRSLRLAMRRC